jgi:hypothetical protein
MASATIICFQPELPRVLPTIHGNADYREFRDQLLRLDHLLIVTGVEAKLIQSDVAAWSARSKTVSAQAQQTRQSHARRALRCNLARFLLQEDYRGFASRLADSPLLQHFCGLDQVDGTKIPSKSTLQRYEAWWPESAVRQAVHELLNFGAAAPAQTHLPAAIDLESVFLDTTCLAAPIHYPVDWVLLRDATRTLVKAMQLIREHGLKHRMPAPETFLTRINTLCMAMTQRVRAQADSQRQRKRTLRKMDRILGTVRSHARRYRQLLDERWPQTDWTRPQAEQVLRRMDQVLEQLPQARQQARRRILQGEAVPNAEKILSLYEPNARVIVRGKAGADVEFGNTLLLGENPQGFILDWELFRQSAPADSALLPRSVGRMDAAYGPRLKDAVGDRGFDSADNRLGLEEEKIYNGVCPRDPRQLRERQKSWKFKRLQKRRAQTEGRIAILKNAFGAGRLRNKGFIRRERAVTWTVLTHNLWLLARLQRDHAEASKRLAA